MILKLAGEPPELITQSAAQRLLTYGLCRRSRQQPNTLVASLENYPFVRRFIRQVIEADCFDIGPVS